MSQNKAILAIFIAILMFSMPCAFSSPVISSYDNSITGDTSQYPHVDHNSNIQFNVTPNESIDTWSWTVNGNAVSNNNPSYTTSFTDWSHQTVTVYGTNVNGNTQTITWYPFVNRQVAGAQNTTAQISEDGYDSMMDALDDWDYKAFLLATTQPYTAVVGNVFFLLIFAVPFVMQWNRQESMLIPSVSGFIVGGVMLAFLPEQYQQFAILFMVIGFGSTMYSLFRDR